MDTYYINGRFVGDNEALISVKDLAVLRGYGVFDFLRTYGQRPFHLADHIHRLRRSAHLIGIQVPWPDDEIASIVTQTLSHNDHPEYNIRLVITGGLSEDSITPAQTPQLIVMVTALHDLPDTWYREGAKVVTNNLQRFVPAAKSINYIPGILAMYDARAQDAIESLYVDHDGHVSEGTTTNFFGFVQGRLLTPQGGLLPGVTRQVVMDLARQKFEVVETAMRRDELRLLEEAFVTASNKQIVPVVQIDSIIVGDGSPGPRTRQIMQLFKDYTEQYARQA